MPFWLCEVDPLLQRLRSTAELPTSPVDVVVVGSGLSGNLAAYHLLKRDPSLKVIMLEADDWCSGATARNGAFAGRHSARAGPRPSSAAPRLCPCACSTDPPFTALAFSPGGHCKPMTYFGYESERKMRGARVANDMLVFEESHLARYAALVEAEDIDCDLHVTRGACLR